MTDESEARKFHPDTRFEQLARRPGGVPRSQAIRNAQAAIDEMKPGFRRWLGQELDELADAVAGASSHPAGGRDRLAVAALHAARIRDVGTTMDFELVTFVASSLCQILDGIAAGAPYRSDVIDCHREALLLVAQEQYRGVRPEQLPELSSGLREVVERALASSEPASDQS
jgi:hypothetical protein